MPATEEALFWWFMNERHRIYVKKEIGAPKPWTTDKILQTYKFTNIFRELDRDTIWVRQNIREPLRDDPELLLFNVALFRQTGGTEGWQGIVRRFDAVKLAAKYVAAQKRGLKVFTGAYMVTGTFPGAKGKPKVESLFHYALQPIWNVRKELVKFCEKTRSLQGLTEYLGIYCGWGGNNFMAYEVACDLLHTPLLEGAMDRYTWANPGPGAQRGLSRLYGGDINMGRGAKSCDRDTCVREMQALMRKAPKKLGSHIDLNDVDMRTIEHSLCEYDKYVRTLHGEGRPRGRYNGTAC